LYFIKDKTQMKKLTIIALVAAFGFVSCKDSNKESNAATTETSTPVASTESHDGHDHNHDHAGHNHGGNEVAQGMNPPHGEPGHRCDIPVGAPLNSEPTQPAMNASPASSGGQGFLGGDAQATSSQPAGGQSQFTTAPGMQGKPNPAHGQPGHRCDIQVGDPLP